MIGVALLVVLVLTCVACNAQPGQTPTLIPTPPPVQIGQPTAIPTEVTNNSDQTSGIILAGAFLVLIILGGTLGATRRKS